MELKVNPAVVTSPASTASKMTIGGGSTKVSWTGGQADADNWIGTCIKGPDGKYHYDGYMWAPAEGAAGSIAFGLPNDPGEHAIGYFDDWFSIIPVVLAVVTVKLADSDGPGPVINLWVASPRSGELVAMFDPPKVIGATPILGYRLIIPGDGIVEGAGSPLRKANCTYRYGRSVYVYPFSASGVGPVEDMWVNDFH